MQLAEATGGVIPLGILPFPCRFTFSCDKFPSPGAGSIRGLGPAFFGETPSGSTKSGERLPLICGGYNRLLLRAVMPQFLSFCNQAVVNGKVARQVCRRTCAEFGGIPYKA